MVSIVYSASGLLVSLASMCTAMQLLPAQTDHDSHRFIKQREDDLRTASMQEDYGFDSEETMQMDADFARRAKHVEELMAFRSSKEARKHLLKSVQPPRKHVVHLHVHNSAGTWMCKTSQLQGGETVTQFPNNCNLEWNFTQLSNSYVSPRSLDGPFTNVIHEDFSGMTCAKRMAEMNNENVTLSMIERWMSFEHGDWCPDDLLYTTIVRDPVKRAGTTIRDNFGDDQIRVLQMLTTSLEAGNTVNVDWLNTHATFNDLMVRTLNGPGAMQLPMGKTTREHLEIAKNRLKKFDAVLAVPTLYTDTVQLVEHLGWPHAVSERKPYSSKETKMNGELEKLLAEYNQLDQELYEFGLHLAWNLTDALLSKGGGSGGRT